ncbi:MAG: hypothetical protein ACOX83_08215 [Candidatus Spyradocola sp.]|jgi:hypothetical protein
MASSVLLLPLRSPNELLPHPSAGMTAFLVVFAVLLVASLTIYIVSAIRNRGKPKPERLGHGNLGGMAGYSGRGPGQGGPPGSSPGAFALFGRKSPYGPYGDDSPPEDPRKR